MRKIVKKMVPLLLIFSMVVSGCSVAPVEGTSDNTSLSVALANRPSSLDPQMANDVMSKICLNPVCDTLFRMTDDNVPVLAMAESYDMSSDGLTYTFHLRDNLRFSNGDPITAEDFAFAFRRIADPTEVSSILLTDNLVRSLVVVVALIILFELFAVMLRREQDLSKEIKTVRERTHMKNTMLSDMSKWMPN